MVPFHAYDLKIVIMNSMHLKYSEKNEAAASWDL